jgi:hypothetical protein
MTDRPWKQHERRAAALIGGRRYTANQGGFIDAESSWAVAQCKEIKILSLASLEALALEIEQQGLRRQKIGFLVIKRRAGRGVPTPTLVIMTAPMLRALSELRLATTKIRRVEGRLSHKPQLPPTLR